MTEKDPPSSGGVVGGRSDPPFTEGLSFWGGLDGKGSLESRGFGLYPSSLLSRGHLETTTVLTRSGVEGPEDGERRLRPPLSYYRLVDPTF